LLRPPCIPLEVSSCPSWRTELGNGTRPPKYHCISFYCGAPRDRVARSSTLFFLLPNEGRTQNCPCNLALGGFPAERPDRRCDGWQPNCRLIFHYSCPFATLAAVFVAQGGEGARASACHKTGSEKRNGVKRTRATREILITGVQGTVLDLSSCLLIPLLGSHGLRWHFERGIGVSSAHALCRDSMSLRPAPNWTSDKTWGRQINPWLPCHL